MAGFQHFKIGQKLIIGFSVMIVLLAGTCLLGIRGMELLDRQLDDLYGTTLFSAIYTNEAYAELLYHNRRCYRHILENNPVEMSKIEDQVSVNEKQFNDILNQYRATDLTPVETNLVNRIDHLWGSYLTAKTTVFNLSRAQDKQTALTLAETELRPVFKDLDGSLVELIHYNLDEGKANRQAAQILFHNERDHLIVTLFVGIAISLLLSWRITRAIVQPVQQVVDLNARLALQSYEQIELIELIAEGNFSQSLPPPKEIDTAGQQIPGDETGELLRSALHINKCQVALSRAMTKMSHALERTRQYESERDWLKSGLNEANLLLRGDKSVDRLTADLLPYLVNRVGAMAGAVYLYVTGEDTLRFVVGHAQPKINFPKTIALGSGLLGQAAAQQQRLCLNELPADYLPLESALGSGPSTNLVILPLAHNKQLLGAMELGAFRPFTPLELEFLDQIADGLALAIEVAQARARIEELLDQAQQQAEELRVQQEELQQSNEELEERAQLLEQQREQISAQNRDIELATEEVRRKADDLERVSAYKSEFLANMSHELRSPLNSLLILSGLLQENRDGNLTEKQVQFAATIQSAGKDLLNLINDILDLAKVEAGHLQLHHETIDLAGLCHELQALYQPHAEEKGLTLNFEVSDDCVATLRSDRQRLQQILRNLLANACKFTDAGTVAMAVRPLRSGEGGIASPGIAFEVRDSGIGVAPEKQQLIFEAFQQADGSTSRKYGGTGLGLSIALQLARRLGGTITLRSTPGKGSIFTLCLPLAESGNEAQIATSVAYPPSPTVSSQSIEEPPPQALPDDRATLTSGERAILIIEDDLAFAELLADMIHSRHFAVLIAADGESGIALAERYQPSAIVLDVMLPRIDGWTVMRHLKDSPRTRHIPVHFITCLDDERKAMAMGAVGYMRKPVDARQLDSVFSTIEDAVRQTMRKLLIVEDNDREAGAMVELLAERNVEITVVNSGKEAIARLKTTSFDCVVLDLGLADMTGFELLEHLQQHKDRKIPVIIHSGQEISREDELRLRHYAESIIIKGAKSPDRLLNEVSLFLHLVESGLSPGKQRMIRLALDQEAMLAGKRILIVDDDLRNIFSLSSILAEKQFTIFEAENGREALARLQEHPDIDLVLMDIMMPEMDGYEAMRAIRGEARFARLPIIAMTAKALKGDLEKCLAAGASDYLSKPIDSSRLFSLLRVWLYPKER